MTIDQRKLLWKR